MGGLHNIRVIFDRRNTASAVRKGSVEIEISYKGQRKRLSTGVNILKQQWKQNEVVDHPDANKLNQQIKQLYNSLQLKMNLLTNKESDVDLSTLTKVRKTNIEGAKSDFLEWVEERIKINNVRESTRRQHLVMLDCLRQFGGIKTFNDITVKNLRLWDDFLKKRVTAQTTVCSYHKRLKTYVNQAVQFEKIEMNPYNNFKVPQGKSEGIKFLTEKERDSIEKLKLEGIVDKVRDMFIFSCYTGLSYSDIIKISKKDIYKEGKNICIRDTRKKTDTNYTLVLLPKALEILKKWKFNLNLVSNQKCNDFLKLIAIKAKIHKRLTMHMGRHTFATWALMKGVDISTVSKMLAHSSVAMTEKYAKVLQLSVVKGYELLK